jgi:transposase
MSSKGRTYSPEFKKEAVELARRTGSSANQLAKELGISQTSLSRWIREAKASERGSDIFDHEAELRRLHKEIERLRMERDILKKATAFFARESR